MKKSRLLGAFSVCDVDKSNNLNIENTATFGVPFRNHPGFCYFFAGFLLLFSGASFGDYKDDIGHAQLAAELGVATPDGSGVDVTQVEADTNPDDPDLITIYSPDPSDPQFSGKSITDVTATSTAFSGHATGVGRTFYGNTSSIAPGITNVESYNAIDWLEAGFLRAAQSGPGAKPQPLSTSSRIANHSWVGYFDEDADTSDALRRVDWVIERDEFIQVVGTNNGSTTRPLLSGAYNTISVGRTDGGHATGTIGVDGVYTANRTRPDIVAPAGTTS